MFVYNDVTRDSRVLREAATLVAAGHRVTIMGRHGPDEREITRHERDGFDIVLVPIPHRWRTWVYRYRRPWRMYGLVRRRFFHHLMRGPAGWIRAVAFLGVAILVAIASLVRLPFIAISGGFNPPKHDSTIDWLIRWRYGVLGWNRAAAAEAPPADVYHGHDLTALPAAVRAQRHDTVGCSSTTATSRSWTRGRTSTGRAGARRSCAGSNAGRPGTRRPS